MTSEEYWHGDSMLPAYYREAHRLRQDDDNQKMWWQGYYDYTAVITALQNSFRKENEKAQPYPSEPFRIREKTELEKEQEEIAERQRIVDLLNQWKADYDREQKEEINGRTGS